MKKHILLIGSFNKARSLAHSLINKNYRVTTINKDYQYCLTLAEIDSLVVIHGDGTKPYVLEDANVKDADIVIALTSNDDVNLVICELCKKKFGVKKTISLVNDPKNTDLFYRLGIDSVVSAVTAITKIIEQQAFLEGIATVIPTGEARISIAEVPIPRYAPVVNKKLWEINLPQEVIIGCILRGENSLIPRGDTRILAGDLLILISSENNEMLAIKELTGQL